jgi:hypothetical protein
VSVHYSELPQELGGDADDAVARFAARANGVCDGIDYPALVTLGRLDKAVRRVHHAAHLVLVAARSGRTDVSDSLGFLTGTGRGLTDLDDIPHPGHTHATAGRRQRSSWRSRLSRDDCSDASAGEDMGVSGVDAGATLPPHKPHEFYHRDHRRRGIGRSLNSGLDTDAASPPAVASNIAQLESAARAIYQTLPWQLRQRFDIEAAFLASRSLTGVYE